MFHSIRDISLTRFNSNRSKLKAIKQGKYKKSEEAHGVERYENESDLYFIYLAYAPRDACWRSKKLNDRKVRVDFSQ